MYKRYSFSEEPINPHLLGVNKVLIFFEGLLAFKDDLEKAVARIPSGFG